MPSVQQMALHLKLGRSVNGSHMSQNKRVSSLPEAFQKIISSTKMDLLKLRLPELILFEKNFCSYRSFSVKKLKKLCAKCVFITCKKFSMSIPFHN